MAVSLKVENSRLWNKLTTAFYSLLITEMSSHLFLKLASHIFYFRLEVRQFALPGAFKELRCEGRLCAKCGNCRDWYYTGDTASWNWIRNRDNWSVSDWKRYHSEDFHKLLKRRDDATCYNLIHRFTNLLGGFSAMFVHHHLCLCEDNVRI